MSSAPSFVVAALQRQLGRDDVTDVDLRGYTLILENPYGGATANRLGLSMWIVPNELAGDSPTWGYDFAYPERMPPKLVAALQDTDKYECTGYDHNDKLYHNEIAGISALGLTLGWAARTQLGNVMVIGRDTETIAHEGRLHALLQSA